MTSKIKVDNINKVSDDSTIIKKCGSTTTVGSGSGQTIVVDGATVTIGRCGGAVNLAPGASQSGFGTPSSSVLWCTTAKTSPFTAEDRKGYFVNTAGGAVTVTLPASPTVGDVVAIKDYNRTFGTNAVTLARNGSNITSVACCATLTINGQSVELVYVDASKGWTDVQNCQSTTAVGGAQYVAATGGAAIYTCGDFKSHHFTASGVFCVSSGGNPAGSNTVDYIVVAGGGGTGPSCTGGGGGGLRYSASSFTMSPEAPAKCNANPSGLPVSAQAYPITVGGGGGSDTAGSSSAFSTITSAGGGKGNNTGGSGGGASSSSCGAAGNTPPVSPPQGNPGGGTNNPSKGRGGGGGGGPGPGTCHPGTGPGVGGTAPSGGRPGSGGVGGGFCTAFKLTAPSMGEAVAVSPSPSTGPTTYYFFAGGGAGYGPQPAGGGPTGSGGHGGGGDAPVNQTGSSGLVNTGGGGGAPGKSGGSGMVIIRYKYQN